jgi:hypothetical protein
VGVVVCVLGLFIVERATVAAEAMPAKADRKHMVNNNR